MGGKEWLLQKAQNVTQGKVIVSGPALFQSLHSTEILASQSVSTDKSSFQEVLFTARCRFPFGTFHSHSPPELTQKSNLVKATQLRAGTESTEFL